MATIEQPASTLPKASLLAGIVAGIAASTCCLGPFVLLALGVSGGWIGNLKAFEPFRPVFIGLTLVFLGLAFRKLYLVPQACALDAPCANPASLRKQRAIFWLVVLFVLTIIAFPWVGPLFME